MESFLADDAWRLNRKVPEMYSLFTFEPRHNSHLGISKLLIETAVNCPGSGKLNAGEGEQSSSFQESRWSK